MGGRGTIGVKRRRGLDENDEEEESGTFSLTLGDAFQSLCYQRKKEGSSVM